jgi:hypothetical protein
MIDPLGGDDWLDAELRNVPLPEHLTDDLLRAIGEASTAEQKLDQQLRAVPIPDDLLFRLRRIPHTTPRQSPVWRRVALAASLLLAVGLSYPFWFTSSKPSVLTTAKTEHRKEIIGKGNSPSPFLEPTTSEVAEDQKREAIESQPVTPEVAIVEIAPNDEKAAVTETPKVATSPVFTTFGTRDPLPAFETVALPRERGIRPPRLAGYDLAYQLRSGLHPWISLAAAPELKTQTPPLTTASESFLATINELRTSGTVSPGRQDIYAEEFLAAMNLQLPTGRNGQPGLTVMGAPTIGKPGVLSLLVAVVMPPVRKPALANAEELSLHMTWNADVVAAYRLIGHEATSATSKGSDARITLHPGESVCLLYELQLQPKGDAVGSVELSWRDSTKPPTDKPLLATRQLQRSRLAKSVEESQPALLLTEAAAQTAEWLRSPRFANVPQWDQLRSACESLPEPLRKDVATVDLVDLIRHIERQGTRGPKAR